MMEFPPVHPNFGCSFAPIIKEPPAVTQLFLMYENPVHEGVYKLSRIDGKPEIYSRWYQKVWRKPCLTPEEAAWQLAWEYFEDEPLKFIGWRGLADRPIGFPIRVLRPKYVTLTPHGLELG